jgi:hypothetical protein
LRDRRSGDNGAVGRLFRKRRKHQDSVNCTSGHRSWSAETGEEELAAGVTGADTQYGTYFENVITAVDALNDPNSLGVLLPYLDAGNIVINRAVSFGPTALDPVLAAMYSPLPAVQAGATFALLAMLAPANVALFSDETSQSKIRAGLTRAKSTALLPFMRSQAEAGLVLLPPTIPSEFNCADLAITARRS